MMNEKTYRAVIPAIPIILVFLCLGTAFATHGWDVQATLVGEQPLETLESLLPAESDVEGEFLEVTDFNISEDGSRLVLCAVLQSPLKIPITIKELAFVCVMNESTVSIRLPEAVEVPAQGAANLKLEGKLPTGQAQSALPAPETLTFASMKMTLDVSGIELRMEQSEQGGVG